MFLNNRERTIRNMKYLIWGTGDKAEELFTVNKDKLTKENGIEIVGFIDNNRDKINFHGIKVYSPNEIIDLIYDYIDIWVLKGYEQIEKQITEELDIPKDKIFNVFSSMKERIANEYKKCNNGYHRPSLELVSVCSDYYKCQQWYKYAYKEFENRKHCYYAYKWVSENIDKNCKILEVACGIGGMLYRLCEDGFYNLTGYDYDVKSVNAANDICKITGANIKIYRDDATHPKVNSKYDVLVWVNGMYHLENYSLKDFFDTHIAMLNKDGFIAFDMIDIKYNSVPQNEYRTDCWNKEGKKESSEYKIRMSEEQVKAVAQSYGLELIKSYDITNAIVPHMVYILQKIG